MRKKHTHFYIFILAFALALMAFHIYVHPESDLVNHYNKIELFRSGQATLQRYIGRLNIGSYVYFWIFSFFTENAYLQAVSAFITYYLMFRLAYNACVDNEVSKRVFMLCIAVILTSYNFYMMVNSIRFWLACSIFFYLLYNEVVRKRKKVLSWAGYILLISFHYGTLILLGCRIGALFLRNAKKPTISRMILIGVCVGCLVFFINTPYFTNLIMDKIDGYSEYTVRGTWQTIVGFIRIVTICALVFISYKKVDERYQEYFNVVLLMSLVPIILYSNYTLILRFGDSIIATSSVALVHWSKVKQYQGLSIRRMSPLFLLVIMCMMVTFAAFLLFHYPYLYGNG